MTKTVIIGIDGVPYRLMDDLSQDNTMPYFKQLREEGVFTKMHSSVPEISSVSWSSIITGKNPGEHSIFGFTDLIEGTYTLSFPHFKKLKCPPFWQKNGTFVILNVPSTYPASALNGVLVSGFISPDLERAVYPPSYLDVLRSYDYKIDVDTKKARKSTTLLFKELFEALESRVKTCHYFWEKFDWDVFMIVFTGSDRLGHFLWHAYEDETHEHHTKFLEFFTRVDKAVQDMCERMDRTDSLIMLSDHGMEEITYDVNVNAYLEEKGFLKRGKDPRMGYNNIREGTKAFALDPGRIYLNNQGRYPLGCVAPEEEEELIDGLVDAFESLKKDGEKVIKKIWHKNNIYHGDYVKYAPDLVLLPSTGVNLKGGILPEKVFDTDPLSGKHTQEDAFLYVKGGDAASVPVPVPENPSVEDVVPILSKLMEW